MTEPWAIFGAVAAAHALGVSSPGPDFAVVVRQTLAHGRRTGVVTGLGIGSGILFHVAWGMFGLGWAVQHFPALIGVLRYAGAAVLLWIGVKALRSQPIATRDDPAATPAPQPSPARAYALGLATNALNAKAFLFFVALCSSVVTAGASIGLRLALGLWLVVATAAYFSFVAWTVGHPAVRRRLLAHAHRIDRAMGAILIALAFAIVFGF
jgi:threonine/homoserine/homoserine lactone efflux protein